MKKTIKIVSSVVAALMLVTASPVSAVTIPINTNVGSAEVKNNSTVTFNSETLTTKLVKPKISGTAFDQKYIQVLIYKDGQSKIFSKSQRIRVRDGAWKTTIVKKLPVGQYSIVVTEYGKSKKILARDILQVESKSSKTVSTTSANIGSDLKVSPIMLLAGGIAKAGASVPISYLQVTNVSDKTVVLKGFKLKQNGSASDKSVIGLTVIDDKGTSRGIVGGSEGAVVFKNGIADFVTESIFPAGQMRLFTLRAIVSQNIADQIGKELSIEISSVSSSNGAIGTFPIRGTTWVIGR